jgi:hypothetical protein
MMNKLQSISRRYMPEAPEPARAETKPNGGNARRRALGDITNAYAGDETKENGAKKPSVAPVTSTTDVNIELMEDRMSVQPDTSDRAYMQRVSDDIDARDANNPLLATCYVNDMYDHFNAVERQIMVNSSYMANQPYVNERMRAILIDWLVSIFA